MKFPQADFAASAGERQATMKILQRRSFNLLYSNHPMSHVTLVKPRIYEDAVSGVAQ